MMSYYDTTIHWFFIDSCYIWVDRLSHTFKENKMKIRGFITYPHSPSTHHNPYIIQHQICLSLGDSAIWFVSLLCIPFIYLWSFMSRISLMDYLDLCILHGRDGAVQYSMFSIRWEVREGRFSCYPHCVYSFYVYIWIY